MKHLLRAMGAAMLAALLLSACSTPQEQTEPSAPQTTQATQAATGATEESATEAEELLALNKELGIPGSLSEVGAKEEMFEAMAEDAMKSGNIAINPRSTAKSDILELYRAAYRSSCGGGEA